MSDDRGTASRYISLVEADRRRTWDDRHRNAAGPGAPSLFVSDALDTLAASSPALVRGPALDLACGRGRHALLLAARGWSVDAVDFSLPALVALRQQASREGLDVRCLAADVGDWPMPVAHYALVVVVGFLDRASFPALRAAVAPGGALVYATQLRTDDAPPAMCPEFYLIPGELEALCGDWTVVLRRDERSLHHGRRIIQAGMVARRPSAPH